MKRACLAALVLTGASAPAWAQSSVTLYGIVDGGILYKTHVGPGGSAWALGTGLESTNRFGLTGAEDLGGGLQATFALESAFRISTGAFINGGQPASAGTVLFDRGATVGLKSNTVGAVLLGKNLSPLLRMLTRIDVTGYVNFGSLNNLLYQNLSGYTGYQYSWVDNSVEYQSPLIGGFEGVAMYSFGGVAGQFATKRVMSAGGSYQYGGLTAAGAYFSGNDPTGTTDAVVARAYTGGVNYRWSQFKFALDFANFKNPSKGTSDNYYTGEIAYTPTANWQLSVTYIRQADRVTSERNASLYKVGVDYFLSKRTSLYALAGYVKNNSLASLGLQNSTPAGVVGRNQLGLGFGMRHSF